MIPERLEVVHSMFGVRLADGDRVLVTIVPCGDCQTDAEQFAAEIVRRWNAVGEAEAKILKIAAAVNGHANGGDSAEKTLDAVGSALGTAF